MKIAIASGKGGTGKTTVSVNLARAYGSEVRLFDCDVEEPNSHLFVQGRLQEQETVSIPVPKVDESLCDACGECGRMCQFKAIISLQTTPLVFPELCHGCGGCEKVCPTGAISEEHRPIGVVETLTAGQITLIQGRLDVGVAMAPPLIRAVKNHLPESGLAILDAPPGTSCPVIATLNQTDFILLVTDPTPFGLHDLKLAVDMIRELDIPCGVVINRAGIGDDKVQAYCRQNDLPVLLEIPEDRRIAEAYSNGLLVVDELPEYRSIFASLPGIIEKALAQARTKTRNS